MPGEVCLPGQVVRLSGLTLVILIINDSEESVHGGGIRGVTRFMK